tara:strand:+ start:200 stop:5632 length:5433 start_codon:yes stop_codon:yes gene_type:complete
MAKISTNFIRGRMNKSVDERLVPVGEYVDAVNVRLGSTETTEIGAVENSKGNTRLTTLEYAGAELTDNARTLGCFEDGINETIYWFVHDENNPNSVVTGVVDMIVSYNTNTNAIVYHVISTQVLNFNSKYLITGVSKIENLLFFTDDFNPPRVINVNRKYDYPDGGIDTVFEEEDVSVIVKPPGYEDYDVAAGQVAPLGTPHVELIEVPGQENYMETKFLSFAYRYRYEDGQYSAISLFSTPAFEPFQFELSTTNWWNEGMINKFNAANVTFSTGSKRVLEVDLLYKQSTSNVIYVIKRFIKKNEGWSDNSFHTVQFTNSEIYTTLGSDELLRLYDNVPLRAKAQTIMGNRLMYGNYVDGFDITDKKDGSQIKIDYYTTALSEPFRNRLIYSSTNPVLSDGTYTIGGAHTETNSVLTFDLTNVAVGGAAIPVGTTLNFKFTLEQSNLPSCTNLGPTNFCDEITIQSSPFELYMTFTCPVEYPDVDTLLSSPEFKNRIGGSVADGFSNPFIIKSLYPCNESDSGSTLSDKFYALAESPMASSNFYLVSGGIDNTACSSTDLDTNPFPTACANQIVETGVTDGTGVNVLIDTSEDFIASGVVVGNIVTDVLTGFSAQVTSVSTNELGLTDINGGINTLGNDNVPYQITTGGGSTPICSPQGFKYTPLGNNKFSLQIPATQYFAADGTSGGDVAIAYRYYNFEQFGCRVEVTDEPSKSSLHSNRDYEVGIVYMDEYGRASTVLTSVDNTVFYPASTSDNKNQIQVTLKNLPPYWAKKYKFVVKPSQGTYETIYAKQFFKQDGTAQGTTGLPVAETNDPSRIWFKLEGQNANLVKTGDELIVKADSNGPLNTEVKAVVLDVQAFSSNGISSDQKSLAGLYMLLKADGWQAEVSDDSIIEYGPQVWSGMSRFEAIVLPNTSYANQYTNGLGYIASCNVFWNFGTFVDLSGLEIYYIPPFDPTVGGTTDLYTTSFYNNYITTGTGLFPYNGFSTDPIFSYGYPLFDTNTNQNYTIPAGSEITIRLTVSRSENTGEAERLLVYERTFVSGYDYTTFYDWALGDDLTNKMTENSPGVINNIGMELGFDAGDYTLEPLILPDLYSVPGIPAGDLLTCKACLGSYESTTFLKIHKNGAGLQYMVMQGNLTSSVCSLNIKVKRNATDFVFETVPEDADANLFYDASDLLEIEGGFHQAKQNFDPVSQSYSLEATDQNQTATQNLVTTLDAYNCYSFGNGVESYRIYDSVIGKPFNLGERVLAVSNQDFVEADRFSDITYSGVYSNSANINNLNEFNLGLVNFQEYERDFGPIQILHARQTDILTLQEDRITYVQVGKNLLSDAVGGGAVVSTPQVLGKQIARIEEYGISHNPESFVAWGYDMYFTDAKRGAVINLKAVGGGADSLNVISSAGMNSWFRDTFNKQLTTQKLGGYDPYMKEYVLGTNLNTVPVPAERVPCGQAINQESSTNSITYDVEVGEVIGTINIPYHISSGDVNISITWNGSVVASVLNATIPGTLSFSKTLNTPTICTVLVTPNVSSTYEVIVECPEEKEIRVVQVVVNSNNYAGQFIHTSYNWSDGSTVSPSTGFSSAQLKVTQPAEYVENIGIRSLGVFPYTGSNITLRTEKFGIDDFDFNPSKHRFRILSSNTQYTNSVADIDALLAASTTVGPISNPVANTFEATEVAMSIPDGNLYLYLIWDLRLVSSQTVCYCSAGSTADDVCCTCTTVCKNVYIGPQCTTQAQACTTDVDTPGKFERPFEVTFSGNSSIPTIGDIVYATLNCGLPTLAPGFYIVSPVSPSVGTKKWIELDNAGTVIDEGNC